MFKKIEQMGGGHRRFSRVEVYIKHTLAVI